MKIAVLGTGLVGQTIATKLANLGHTILVGSRDRENAKAKSWIQKLKDCSLGTFTEAAHFGELIFNCTNGAGSLDALKLAGAKNLASKIMIDLSNPLDFSKDRTPRLFVCNDDSLAEQIQRTYPQVKVVKTLNTLTTQLMVNPKLLSGRHNLFIAGNDSEAKKTVRAFIVSNFAWQEEDFIDLGDLTGARASEMIVLMWIRLWGSLQNPVFNYKIVT